MLLKYLGTYLPRWVPRLLTSRKGGFSDGALRSTPAWLQARTDNREREGGRVHDSGRIQISTPKDGQVLTIILG